MAEPRESKIILKEISDIDDVIEKGKIALQKFPQDFGIIFMLKQDEARKTQLLEEYRESLSSMRIHVLDFVFEIHDKKIPLPIIIGALQELNQLLNKITEKIINKKFGKIELYLDAIFSGSYGVILSTPWDNKLFDSEYMGSFKILMDSVNQIFQKNNIISIHDILKDTLKGDHETIRRYKKFFEAVKKTETSIRIKWKNPIEQKEYIARMDYDNLVHICNFLSVEKPLEEFIDVLGKIKAIDLLQHTIKLQREDIGDEIERKKIKSIIQSKFQKELENEIKNIIDKSIKVKFKRTIEYNETTEEEIEKWELIKIIGD